MKPFKDELATSEIEHLVVFAMYLRNDFEAELKEAVNGLKSTIEQPREDGCGKDLIMKFAMQLQLQAAVQRNQDELKEVVKKVGIRKEWVENTLKQIEELETRAEWVENACI
ncbi:hypothetical protein RchiOBHm_Chr5g0049741 [Rosa chinensis]|uniref:Uncharacterized protein n=1 Tax=Rosa chinensis TaxID=74649 RepID=A0A2P6QEZ1_ROSCH|nr:hypothetical protein RchiOBHm_Chr5g0049741 [Rosa chinensis]